MSKEQGGFQFMSSPNIKRVVKVVAYFVILVIVLFRLTSGKKRHIRWSPDGQYKLYAKQLLLENFIPSMGGGPLSGRVYLVDEISGFPLGSRGILLWDMEEIRWEEDKVWIGIGNGTVFFDLPRPIEKYNPHRTQ